jgi:hypothetical protein
MATKKQTAAKSDAPAEPAEQPQEGAICTVPDSDKPVHVRGLCEDHWADPKA